MLERAGPASVLERAQQAARQVAQAPEPTSKDRRFGTIEPGMHSSQLSGPQHRLCHGCRLKLCTVLRVLI